MYWCSLLTVEHNCIFPALCMSISARVHVGIYGGHLLGVRSTNSLAFYSWDSLELVRRIMIVPQKIYWSEGGDLVAICTEDSFFILRYNPTAVDEAFENKDDISEDGVEEAFEVSRQGALYLVYMLLCGCQVICASRWVQCITA